VCSYNTKSQISGLNIKKMFLVPKSFTHKSFDGAKKTRRRISHAWAPLKGLSHEIDFKNVDENGQILALLRAAAGF
jgi:hypothetical protein